MQTIEVIRTLRSLVWAGKGSITKFVPEPSSGGVHLFKKIKKSLHNQQRHKSGEFYTKQTDALSVEAATTFPQINITKCLKNSHLKRLTLIYWSYHNQVPQSGYLNQYSIFILNSEIQEFKSTVT